MLHFRLNYEIIRVLVLNAQNILHLSYICRVCLVEEFNMSYRRV